MPTDATWTWTILMRDGKLFHVDLSCNIHELISRFLKAGYHEAEIEAIIRH